MRVGRTDERDMETVGRGRVIGVASLSSQQTLILDAGD